MSEPITDPSAERAARELYVGLAHDGPLDGQEVTSRFPKGLVAVDRAAGKAFIYDYTDGVFTVRDEAGVDLDNEKRWAAAEGTDYDVVAVG